MLATAGGGRGHREENNFAIISYSMLNIIHLFHGPLSTEGHFSQELQVIFWTFFTNTKGTFPPERGHFLCLLKNWGSYTPGCCHRGSCRYWEGGGVKCPRQPLIKWTLPYRNSFLNKIELQMNKMDTCISSFLRFLLFFCTKSTSTPSWQWNRTVPADIIGVPSNSNDIPSFLAGIDHLILDVVFAASIIYFTSLSTRYVLCSYRCLCTDGLIVIVAQGNGHLLKACKIKLKCDRS